MLAVRVHYQIIVRCDRYITIRTYYDCIICACILIHNILKYIAHYNHT